MTEKIWAAIIGGLAGTVVSMVTSYVIQVLKNKQEIKTWNNNFTVNYAKLLIESPEAAFGLSRQFSVGLIILRDNEGRTDSKYFIPGQCKVSVGRRRQ